MNSKSYYILPDEEPTENYMSVFDRLQKENIKKDIQKKILYKTAKAIWNIKHNVTNSTFDCDTIDVEEENKKEQETEYIERSSKKYNPFIKDYERLAQYPNYNPLFAKYIHLSSADLFLYDYWGSKFYAHKCIQNYAYDIITDDIQEDRIRWIGSQVL